MQAPEHVHHLVHTRHSVSDVHRTRRQQDSTAEPLDSAVTNLQREPESCAPSALPQRLAEAPDAL